MQKPSRTQFVMLLLLFSSCGRDQKRTGEERFLANTKTLLLQGQLLGVSIFVSIIIFTLCHSLSGTPGPFLVSGIRLTSKISFTPIRACIYSFTHRHHHRTQIHGPAPVRVKMHGAQSLCWNKVWSESERFRLGGVHLLQFEFEFGPQYRSEGPSKDGQHKARVYFNLQRRMTTHNLKGAEAEEYSSAAGQVVSSQGHCSRKTVEVP